LGFHLVRRKNPAIWLIATRMRTFERRTVANAGRDSTRSAMDENGEVTRLVASMTAGDRGAFDERFPLVYDELRDIAHRHLRGEREGQTLATTDLVHEAYFALVGIDRVSWSDRAHFLAVATGRVVECRFFAGMSIEETAAVLGVSPATVKRDWVLARAWLHRELTQ
jgi:DNA-directed RNA polymerase specialized sigma24 family protein